MDDVATTSSPTTTAAPAAPTRPTDTVSSAAPLTSQAPPVRRGPRASARFVATPPFSMRVQSTDARYDRRAAVQARQ
jgi:hypothetical protein